jgi:hypothetical protein
VREATAALFAKLLMDKLRGPKIKILVCKFLPAIFTDAMRDNPEAAVAMFEGTHENPELIWNEDARSKVQTEIVRLRDEYGLRVSEWLCCVASACGNVLYCVAAFTRRSVWIRTRSSR